MERLKKVLIRPDETVKQVLKHMDAVGEKTLFVSDPDNRLLGTVTDGDIRRWILKGRSLDDVISRVMNSRPVFLPRDFDQEKAKTLMLRKGVECLPVIEGDRCIVAAVWWVDLFKSALRKRASLKLPVVIMAGGEGARLHPFTKIIPKPLMPLGEKPIIEIIVDRFFHYGCKDFYLSLNYKSNIIKAYFSDFEHKYRINYILENKPLGTAGSLHFLKSKIKRTFFVSNCDILIETDYADILKFHRQRKNCITLVSSMKNFTIPYGVCKIQDGGGLKFIHEKPEYDFLVNTGMYILEPSVLSDIPANEFYNITDLINDYLKRGKKVGVYPVSEKSWVDIGQMEEMQNTLRNIKI
ncbi:MAG: nucleotidyltransferase family protein [Candidatus Omnitrophota bacterium]